MNNYITKDNVAVFDAVGLDSYYSNLDSRIDYTDSDAADSFLKRNFVNIIFVGSSILFCAEESKAFSKFVNLNSSSIEESFLKNYSDQIDGPMNNYFSELNKSVLKVKSYRSEIVTKIVSFESLKSNWDGYGAIPLEVKAAANTINFLHLLDDVTVSQIDDVFPTANGTLSILWKNNSRERISFEIGNTNFSYYVKYNSQKPLFFSGNNLASEEAQRVMKFVKSL